MSYILEALKKSQNERELGQVPTLVAVPATESHRAPRGKPWGLVAVGLATIIGHNWPVFLKFKGGFDQADDIV